jgi:hypothetical protein
LRWFPASRRDLPETGLRVPANGSPPLRITGQIRIRPQSQGCRNAGLRAPILEVIKRQPKQILLAAFARMAEQAPFYIFTAFIFSYGTGTPHLSRDFLLTVVLAASVVSFFSIPFFGHLSDRIGRNTM